ncbi:hypothetical protein OIU84_013867 [Salix udensis]|uniref:glutathione transferase n=1 Tax=Salix udensis TaxID=889485 RepID=A0AAD6NV08_9ROSI|nr:hypothetical protein OIU84_013867 [Salix udensis]
MQSGNRLFLLSGYKRSDIHEQKLGQTRFLAGDEFSLPDFHTSLMGTKLVNSTSRKNVNRWWTEISNRASWKKVLGTRKNA